MKNMSKSIIVLLGCFTALSTMAAGSDQAAINTLQQQIQSSVASIHQEMAAQQASTQKAISDLQTQVQTQIAHLQTEMQQMQTQLSNEIKQVQAESVKGAPVVTAAPEPTPAAATPAEKK